MYNLQISVEESVKQLSDQFEHKSGGGIYNIYARPSRLSLTNIFCHSMYFIVEDLEMLAREIHLE